MEIGQSKIILAIGYYHHNQTILLMEENMNKNIQQTDKQLLGCVANLRHIRNLLRTALASMDTDLSVYPEEAMKELKQDMEKSITVCENELRKYEHRN